MQALEAIGTVDTKGNLTLVKPLQIRNQKVKVIILITEINEGDDITEIEDSNWWHEIPAEQQAHILKSYKESYNPENWIDHEEVKKLHAKWLHSSSN
jgi:hypothetical protein